MTIRQGASRGAALLPLPRSGATTLQGVAGRSDGVERVLIADDHPLVRDGLRTVIAVAFDGTELF